MLKQRRLENDLSQKELAHIAGLSMRAISLMECNKQQPSITTIEALAEALHTSMAELIEAIELDKKRNKAFTKARRAAMQRKR